MLSPNRTPVLCEEECAQLKIFHFPASLKVLATGVGKSPYEDNTASIFKKSHHLFFFLQPLDAMPGEHQPLCNHEDKSRMLSTAKLSRGRSVVPQRATDHCTSLVLSTHPYTILRDKHLCA